MAPTRVRRARAGAAERRDRDREQRERDRDAGDSDEEAPQYNLISCALKFTEEEGAKQASKATKIKNDLKRQAADYSKKMDEVVLGQEKELDTLWQKYAKQSLDDDRERKVLLQALAQNYASIEKVIVALHESAINFEKQRHDTNTKMLTRAQEEVNASHTALVRAVRSKKTAFNTRRIAGQRHNAALAARG